MNMLICVSAGHNAQTVGFFTHRLSKDSVLYRCFLQKLIFIRSLRGVVVTLLALLTSGRGFDPGLH